MNQKQTQITPTLKVAAAATFAALVFVATYSFWINIPSTSGYFNLGEIVIYVASLTFGPISGALAGGIGAMTADMLLAPQFAIGTLIIKGIEGAIVGILFIKLRTHIQNRSLIAAISMLAGGIEMITGYFIYEQLVLGYPRGLALAEVPFNAVQMLIGIIIAIPVMHTITRLLPQFKK